MGPGLGGNPIVSLDQDVSPAGDNVGLGCMSRVEMRVFAKRNPARLDLCALGAADPQSSLAWWVVLGRWGGCPQKSVRVGRCS